MAYSLTQILNGLLFDSNSLGQIAPDSDSKICGQIAPNYKKYPYYNTQTIAISAFQALTTPVMYRRSKVK
jgi:hypothetical protein